MSAKAVAGKKSAKSSSLNKKSPSKKWSAHVTETSDAVDLEKDVFKSGSAEKIAASLKRSADKSSRKKGTPFQSAMSMLNFYINRAGKNLPERRLKTLEAAKDKLRHLYHREEEK
jgi:hypothetical protein